MKNTRYLLWLLSILILGAGCQKELPSSVTVNGRAKGGTAGLPGFSLGSPTPEPIGVKPSTPSQRIIAFDNGSGLTCLLAYDLATEQVTLYQAQGGLTQLWTTVGLTIDGAPFHFGESSYRCIDEFNESGGTHLVALDLDGNGHMNYLLLYIPGTGIAKVLQNLGNGNWGTRWQSTTGVAGYDLKSPYDKIIAYDLGSGSKSALICYRPGNGNCWAIQNQPFYISGGQGNPPILVSPNWVGVVKGSSGIGGFDLKGFDDQIVAVNNTSGNMDLLCYRPFYGNLWYLSHVGNTTVWTARYSSGSGFPGFGLFNRKDRIIAYDADGVGTQNWMLCYSPGQNGYNALFRMVHNSNGSVSLTSRTLGDGGDFKLYPMTADPYVNPIYGGTATYAGDHILGYNGNDLGLSSLFCYAPGYNLADIFWFNGTFDQETYSIKY
jgi:hypothetical protein